MATGILYVVATPIGNLEDISTRALRILKEVDLIACEDTRHTQKLLSHYHIHTRLVSYYQYVERVRTHTLLSALKQGKKVALVSDAGTPGISDPGEVLVQAAVENGIPVVPIPGPSAVIAALSTCGLPTSPFIFEGFLPPKSHARQKALQALAQEKRTVVFYEAPHRVVETLRDMANILGNRRAVVVRELTKIHEEWVRGGLEELQVQFAERASLKGEVVLIVEGKLLSIEKPSEEKLRQEILELMQEKGQSLKEAAKFLAHRYHLKARDVYSLKLKK